MVILTTPLLTAIAVLSAVTSAAPSHRHKRDSSTNEPAFSAPNGVIESTAASPTPVVAGSSWNSNGNYGQGSGYGSNSNYNNNQNWNPSSGSGYSSGSGSSGSGYGSNNWSQGSQSGSQYGQGSNSWGSGSGSGYGSNQQNGNWDSSSSVDTWTSTSTADNSWQTSSDSWITSSADNSWQTTTSSADNSWQTTSQTTWEATSTTVEAAPTATSWSTSGSGSSGYSSSSSSYGSGSSNWGTDYNNCVSQCQAQWNMLPPPSTTQPPSYGSGSSSSSSGNSWNSNGTPTTHTVIVAPTKGVLRYIPFAINASVGDTISWQWRAGPHTVTKSSEATPCNKTLDNPFASGQQNASFVFNQVINDTNPVFYYCGVPGHCEKGMFGIVNPASTFSIDTNLESQILAQAAASPTMAAMVSMVNNMTMGTSAYTWGNSFDTSNVPPEQMQSFIENALFTRLFYAANNGSLESGMGAYSPSGSLVIPQDLPVLMASANAANGTSSDSSSSAAMPSASAGASSGAYGSMTTSGASHRIAYSGGFLAVAAVVIGSLLA